MKNFSRWVWVAVTAAFSQNIQAAENPITISGLLEVEASAAEDYSGAQSNDIVLATAALAVDAQINDRVSAHAAFLYEEDETDFSLEEGIISLMMSDSTALSAGRMFVPFGSFESHMISDPMTLELGETSETALMVGIEKGEISGAVYAFNGDSGDTGATDDNELSFGANIAYATDTQWVGASYLSNIADSDGLQGDGTLTVDSSVAGIGINFGMNFSNVTLLAEHVAAAENFRNGDLGGDIADKEQPSTSHVELGMALENGMTVAMGYQMSDEAAFMGLPESVTSVALAYELMDGAALAFEYAAMEDYSTADGGSGENATALTAQLAVEF